MKGKVVDAQGKPVEGATITIQSADPRHGATRRRSNKKGEFVQIGLAPGHYKVTAEKEKLTQTR